MAGILKNSIIALQTGYFLMFFNNGVGKLNMIVNDLGYIVWSIFAFLSLIVGIFAFYKTRKKTIIYLSIICGFEIVFCAFIRILPSIIGIPF
jgi:uncharacterized membrane protein